MMGSWEELKLQYPTQINAVTIVDDKGNQGTFMHIRTALFNHLTRREIMTPELIKFRERQNNATIDTLTNTLKTMDADIINIEKTLNTKYDEANITKEVLGNKLEDAIKALHLKGDDVIDFTRANENTIKSAELYNEETT